MTQNGQGPEPQYPAVPPAHDGAHGEARSRDGGWAPSGGRPGGQPLPPAQPLPPEAAPGAADMQSTQYLAPIPPQPGYGYPTPQAQAQQPGYGYPPPQAQTPQPGYGYPHPATPAPASDMQATQHIAPVPGAMPPPQGPQPGYGYPPPQAQAQQPGYGYPHPATPAPASDMQATQHIAPVPPQRGGGDSTQFLGTGPLAQQGGPGPAGASDATRYIAPVPPAESGERQPPAEFDSLFRTEAPQQPQGHRTPPPAPGPYRQQPPQHHQQPPQPPQGYAPQNAHYDDEEPAPRRRSPVALIAAVVVGCAVVGLGAGALLSGEDEKKEPEKSATTVAATPSAPPPAEQPSEKPADPAEPQAQELSKLLATSSDSRDTVISSVESVKQCKNLDKAAADLRGAAQQRRGLITRLQSLSVDKVPDHGRLTAALTEAWKASASADDHYAAWADQMKAKNGCKGGKARSTNHLSAANNDSGTATRAKKKAAGLWNPTAEKYGLEKRAYTQL
ncbi:hypothetical protein [Streptomyces sp. NPDC012825]|uniref:hypothetical protein n=1 Tax=Streptomyces sp. NPDC012825 TaxID=3364851 RepID=UPI0036CAB7C5